MSISRRVQRAEGDSSNSSSDRKNNMNSKNDSNNNRYRHINSNNHSISNNAGDIPGYSRWLIYSCFRVDFPVHTLFNTPPGMHCVIPPTNETCNSVQLLH